MNLLSVDFDFFTPVATPHPDDPLREQWMLYDWNALDNSFFSQHLWPIRAATFIAQDMPLPVTSGEETDFWTRFRFTPNATLYVADSHMEIATPEVRKKVRKVVSYDAHHDHGYNRTRAAIIESRMTKCDDWAVWYDAIDIPTEVVYPRWKPYGMDLEGIPAIPVTWTVDTGKRKNTKFGRIFVCRSGPWVPSWHDEAFRRFVDACPVNTVIELDDTSPRDFEPEQVEMIAGQMREAHARNMESRHVRMRAELGSDGKLTVATMTEADHAAAAEGGHIIAK